MNSTTAPPAITDGDVAVGYVLVPFFLFTVIGIVVAVVSLCDTFKVTSTGIDVNIPSFFLFQIMYIRKRKRYDVQLRQVVFYSTVYWLIKIFFFVVSQNRQTSPSAFASLHIWSFRGTQRSRARNAMERRGHKGMRVHHWISFRVPGFDIIDLSPVTFKKDQACCHFSHCVIILFIGCTVLQE